MQQGPLTPFGCPPPRPSGGMLPYPPGLAPHRASPTSAPTDRSQFQLPIPPSPHSEPLHVIQPPNQPNNQTFSTTFPNGQQYNGSKGGDGGNYGQGFTGSVANSYGKHMPFQPSLSVLANGGQGQFGPPPNPLRLTMPPFNGQPPPMSTPAGNTKNLTQSSSVSPAYIQSQQMLLHQLWTTYTQNPTDMNLSFFNNAQNQFMSMLRAYQIPMDTSFTGQQLPIMPPALPPPFFPVPPENRISNENMLLYPPGASSVTSQHFGSPLASPAAAISGSSVSSPSGLPPLSPRRESPNDPKEAYPTPGWHSLPGSNGSLITAPGHITKRRVDILGISGQQPSDDDDDDDWQPDIYAPSFIPTWLKVS